MPTMSEVKTQQQATWRSGDYGQIARLTSPFGDVLCDEADVMPESRVLDVATGTGHVALASARRFCSTCGVDYAPELLEQARARALAEGLDAEFIDGDAEQLPFEDGTFDYVVSALGVMFTTDHARAADEMSRVLRPGGTMALASWTLTGFIGQLLKIVASYVSPPPGIQPPVRWGTEEYLDDLMGESISMRSRTESLTVRFPTPDFFADFFIENYGPTKKAFESLDAQGREAYRDDLIGLARDSSRASDAAVMDWEYLVTLGRK